MPFNLHVKNEIIIRFIMFIKLMLAFFSNRSAAAAVVVVYRFRHLLLWDVMSIDFFYLLVLALCEFQFTACIKSKKNKKINTKYQIHDAYKVRVCHFKKQKITHHVEKHRRSLFLKTTHIN